MADSIAFAQYATESAGKVFNYSQVDLDSAHRFWFGSQIQKRSIRRATLGILLASVGIGSILSANSWPSMAAPLTTTGGVMMLLGLSVVLLAWFDRQSRLTITRRGVEGRVGFTPVSFRWSQVDRWAIHQQGNASKTGMVVWFKTARLPLVIEGAYLDSSDRRLLTRVFRAFMQEGEVDPRVIEEMMPAVKAERVAPMKWA